MPSKKQKAKKSGTNNVLRSFPREKTKRLSAARRRSNFIALLNSCAEGYTTEWDCSTSEGREAFLAMHDQLLELALDEGITFDDELKECEPEEGCTCGYDCTIYCKGECGCQYCHDKAVDVGTLDPGDEKDFDDEDDE